MYIHVLRVLHTHTHINSVWSAAHEHICGTMWLVIPKELCFTSIYSSSHYTRKKHSAVCDWLSMLHCSVIHLSSKRFVDRLLRYCLWPAWNCMEGIIWSTTCCMYFCNQETFTTRKTTFLTEAYLCVYAFIYAFCAHTRIPEHTYRLWWSFLVLRAVSSASSWPSLLLVCPHSFYACM